MARITNPYGEFPPTLHFAKPVKVYFLRHGESAGNLSKVLQGNLDMALSQRGKEQAESLAIAMREVELSAIYSSDLRRAKDTARFIAAEQKKNLVIKEDKRLREVNSGVLEGMSWVEIEAKYPEDYKAYHNLVDFAPAGGETTAEVLDRALEFLLDTLPHYQGRNIAIVAHGFLMACIVNYCQGKRLAEAEYEIYENASISEIEFYGSREFSLHRLNDFSHLKQIK